MLTENADHEGAAEMFQNIVKRDGKIVKFDSTKITAAIAKAGKATGEFGKKKARRLTKRVLVRARELGLGPIPDVEEIQDIVEKVLLNSPFHKSAKGLAALSDTSDSMAKELAKMLLEKAESGDSRSLKDIWAAYRKKEVQVEVKMNRGVPSGCSTGVAPADGTGVKSLLHSSGAAIYPSLCPLVWIYLFS